ncbi:MAG TPA: shikimate dehydrogenase [Prolixibacteraceae bacterium]|nr:shikimate dehydrogenase [Prolixibacteraceae bacterium]
MKTFGLIGYPLGHSFSKKFFTEKFAAEQRSDHQYLNFEIDSIEKFPDILSKNPDLAGLNCTIPYKQAVIPYLDEIDEEALKVGAVNTVKISGSGIHRKLKGYNTDIIGFERSLAPMLGVKHKKALILGTGGASKAIQYVLSKWGIDFLSASIEDPLYEKEIRYHQIDAELLAERLIIIHATPLGTYPKVDACPPIPYVALTPDHILFDLVYNPEVTLFLKKGKENGAKVKNGLEMLHGQAIAAWDIWNE